MSKLKLNLITGGGVRHQVKGWRSPGLVNEEKQNLFSYIGPSVYSLHSVTKAMEIR